MRMRRSNLNPSYLSLIRRLPLRPLRSCEETANVFTWRLVADEVMRKSSTMRALCFLALLCFVGCKAQAAAEPKQAQHPEIPKRGKQVILLRSDPLPTPLMIPGDTLKRQITSIEITGEIQSAQQDAKGSILLDDSPVTFNRFGDATRTGKKAEPSPIKLKWAGYFDRGLPYYEIVFADGSLLGCLHLAIASDAAYSHRLLINLPAKLPEAEKKNWRVIGSNDLVMFVDLHGTPARPDAMGDRSLSSKVLFTTLEFSKGRPHSFRVSGTLDGPGILHLDGNYIGLNSYGTVQSTTQVYYTPINVQLKAVDTPDPSKKGRRLYDINPEIGEAKRKFSLVLSSNEAGPHRLLVREGDKLVQMHNVIDPERQEHLAMESRLAKTSAEEKKAIAQLRKTLGYSFRFYVEATAVNFLYVTTPVDADSLDPALQGLKNLSELHFQGGRLRAAGLKSLQHMPKLKRLYFTSTEIDDEGLACVKDLTHLEIMMLFGCRGITDKVVAHFQGLKNLKHLDLRDESAALSGVEPKEPRITDAGLKHFAGLTKLEYLNLMGQKITDESLKHLSGMPDLRFLALSFSGITDKGLKHLEGLQKLRELHLSHTRVTPEGRAALKSKLPDLDR